MIAVNEVLPTSHAKMLLQVHDELVFEADEDKADTIADLIKMPCKMCSLRHRQR
jgi:DNA polymerase-1